MFSYRRLLLLGFGFMGVSLLWGIYNAYVPIFLLSGCDIIDIFSNTYRIAFMYGAVTLVIALFFVIPIKRGEALIMEDGKWEIPLR